MFYITVLVTIYITGYSEFKTVIKFTVSNLLSWLKKDTRNSYLLFIFNRPGVSGTVYKQARHYLSESASQWSFSLNIIETISIPNRKS